MKIVRLIIICVAAVLVVFGLATYFSRPPDPVYNGKRLSEWLTEVNTGTWPRQGKVVPADEAVRHIGTNAFPMIEQLLRHRDSALMLKWITLAKKYPAFRYPLNRLGIRTQMSYHSRAISACHALGNVAKPMVPKVVEALGHMSPYEQLSGLIWLGSLGPDADAAVPAVIALLRDKSNPTRAFAADALVRISTQHWEDVLPVFTECLRDQDLHVKDTANYAFELARKREDATNGQPRFY